MFRIFSHWYPNLLEDWIRGRSGSNIIALRFCSPNRKYLYDLSQVSLMFKDPP
jgi:hypothetical protein